LTKLTWCANCLLTMTLLGITSLAVIVFLQIPNWRLYTMLVLAATLAAAFHFEKARRNVVAARLIIENQIMHIKLVDFDEKSKSIEAYVSCFGVLIDSRIIKFNQSGIWLKTVDLRRDFTSLTYVEKERTQSIKIFHPANKECELAEVARRFRYETGVVPVIEDMKA